MRDKADAVSEQEAIDCLNVVFTERGAVQQRAGFVDFATGLTNDPVSLEAFYQSSGTRQLLAGCGTRLEAIATNGTVVDSEVGLTQGIWDFVRFGGPGNEVAYAGNGENLLYKWDGSTWASVASTPKAAALDVMAVDQGNRLVAGRVLNPTTGSPAGGTSTASTVYFSDPGAPETWGANNFIQFTPGDGEQVQAIIAWGEFVFVFKESKFFVIYGSSEDEAGNPIFNYRTVDTGVGMVSPRAICKDERAVYFMARDGVYSTTGGEPTKVGDLIDPIFLGGSSGYYTGGELAHNSIANCTMTAHEDRIYLAFPTASANDRILIYDPRYQWWSLWNVAATSMASFRISDQAELVAGHADNKVIRHNSTLTDDNGTAISAHWRSGWFDYGITEQKTIRETKIWGVGDFNCAVSTDFHSGIGDLEAVSVASDTSTTWGGSTWGGGTWAEAAVLSPALRRRSERGTVFSTYFENNILDATFAVHRLTHNLRETRIASVIR